MKHLKNPTQGDFTAEAGDWLTFSRFALLLGVLVILGFPQVVLGLETFVSRDFGHFAYPLAFYHRQCFWRGEVPLWNPYNNCGVPFLAQWNTMPLYPPTLIYLLFPLGWSLGIFCLLHLWFAGLGMYMLALRWTGNRAGAALAGLVFAFNGLSVSSLMWPSNLATLSWMPWVVGLGERGWREGGNRVIYAALAGTMQVLAGGPETIAFTWLLVAAVWTADMFKPMVRPGATNAPLGPPGAVPGGPGTAPARAMPSPWAFASQSGVRLAWIVVIVAALSAAQLLPTLDLISHSQRERGYGDTNWSMPLRGWVNFLVPLAFAQRWVEGTFFQSGQGWVSSFYVGTLTLVLAALCLRQRSPRIWALLAASLGAYLCSLGAHAPLLPWLRHVVPLVSLMRYPIKFVIIIVFATPLLAAFGMAWLMTNNPEAARRRQMRFLKTGAVVLALIAAVLLWVRTSGFSFGTGNQVLLNGLVRAGFLAGMGVLFLALLRNRVPKAQGMILLLLLLTVWLDLWTHAPTVSSTITPSAYTPGIVKESLALIPEPVLGGSRVMISPYADQALDRLPGKDVQQGLLARRLAYFSDLNLLDGAPKVDGFFPLYPREIEKVVSLLYSSTNASFPRLADFLSVSHATAPGEFTEWQRRQTFFPVVTAGQKPLFLDDTSTIGELVQPEFDGSKTVFLPAEAQSQVLVRTVTKAAVSLQRFQPHQVSLTVNADAPSLVVISQTYYHCWHAYVDDQPQPLLRANFAFQAVQVREGMHQVRLVYEDRAFQLGVAISLATAVGCVVWALRGRRGRSGAGWLV